MESQSRKHGNETLFYVGQSDENNVSFMVQYADERRRKVGAQINAGPVLGARGNANLGSGKK
jgi:hypothetical protein